MFQCIAPGFAHGSDLKSFLSSNLTIITSVMPLLPPSFCYETVYLLEAPEVPCNPESPVPVALEPRLSSVHIKLARIIWTASEESQIKVNSTSVQKAQKMAEISVQPTQAQLPRENEAIDAEKSRRSSAKGSMTATAPQFSGTVPQLCLTTMFLLLRQGPLLSCQQSCSSFKRLSGLVKLMAL